MSITKNSKQHLIDTIKEKDWNEAYQNQLAEKIKSFIDNYSSVDRVSCAEAMGDLFGGNPYFIPDKMFGMKHLILDLVTFLTDKEISEKFKCHATYSGDYSKALKRLLVFIDQVRNRYAVAEMQLALFEDGVYEMGQLKFLDTHY